MFGRTKKRKTIAEAALSQDFRVIVRDNFHYMDESEQYEDEVFATYELALSRAKRIVDDFLALQRKPGMSGEFNYEVQHPIR